MRPPSSTQAMVPPSGATVKPVGQSLQSEKNSSSPRSGGDLRGRLVLPVGQEDHGALLLAERGEGAVGIDRRVRRVDPRGRPQGDDRFPPPAPRRRTTVGQAAGEHGPVQVGPPVLDGRPLRGAERREHGVGDDVGGIVRADEDRGVTDQLGRVTAISVDVVGDAGRAHHTPATPPAPQAGDAGSLLDDVVEFVPGGPQDPAVEQRVLERGRVGEQPDEHAEDGADHREDDEHPHLPERAR
jgi:hypothetical protein